MQARDLKPLSTMMRFPLLLVLFFLFVIISLWNDAAFRSLPHLLAPKRQDSDEPDLFSMSAFMVVNREPVASFETFQHFRMIYPEAPLHVVQSLGGFNFSRMAAFFNATYEAYPANVYNIGPLSTYVQFLVRIFQRFNETYVMLLEDDVRVLNKQIKPLKGILNGECLWSLFGSDCDIFLLSYSTLTNFSCEHTQSYSGHGGSIYNRAAFIDLVSSPLVANVSNLQHYIMREHYWNDRAISTLLIFLGGTNALNCVTSQKEFSKELYNSITSNYSTKSINFNKELYFNFIRSQNASILHRWKREYGLTPPSYIMELVDK